MYAQKWSIVGARGVLMKLKLYTRFVGSERGRKTEYITMPYSNDSQTITNGLLVSFFTDVPRKNAKSLALF